MILTESSPQLRDALTRQDLYDMLDAQQRKIRAIERQAQELHDILGFALTRLGGTLVVSYKERVCCPEFIICSQVKWDTDSMEYKVELGGLDA